MLQDKSETATPIAYTPQMAAHVTGRNRTRIFNAIRGGELSAMKDGKATLIERSELERWVASLPQLVPRGVAA